MSVEGRESLLRLVSQCKGLRLSLSELGSHWRIFLNKVIRSDLNFKRITRKKGQQLPSTMKGST